MAGALYTRSVPTVAVAVGATQLVTLILLIATLRRRT